MKGYVLSAGGSLAGMIPGHLAAAGAVIVALALGYLLGCSNMAWYLSKRKGVNLRKTGSKNLGTSNTFIGLGIGAAVLVFLHDVGKTLLASYVSVRLFPDVEGIGAVAGAAAVVGHIFPFYLHFKGGKGVAAYLGLILAQNRWVGLAVLLGVVLVTMAVDYFPITTVVLTVGYCAYAVCTESAPLTILAVAAASALVLLVHRENFVRMYYGQEIGMWARLRSRKKEA